MLNERITENIVRNLLREKGYYDDQNILVEEQKSQNPQINKLLQKVEMVLVNLNLLSLLKTILII